MEGNLVSLISDLSLSMRLVRARLEVQQEDVSEREALILEVLDHRAMRISEIAATYPVIAESTLSTTVSNLARRGLVTKQVDQKDQRLHVAELSDLGRKTLDDIQHTRAERFEILVHAIGVSNKERMVLERVFARAIKYLREGTILLSKLNG